MTNALTPTKNPKSNVTTQKRHEKNSDYTTFADRLRTVSWINDSHPINVVIPVYGISTFPLTTKAVYSKAHKHFVNNPPYEDSRTMQQPTKAEML